MSEFTKLSTRLGLIQQAVNDLLTTYPNSLSSLHESTDKINNETLLRDYQSIVDHITELTDKLLPGFDRFVAKFHTKDPVTGEERYGNSFLSSLVVTQPVIVHLSHYISLSHVMSTHAGLAMKTKILDRHEQSLSVLASATTLSTTLQPLVEQIQLERQMEETKRQRMETDHANAQRIADEQATSFACTAQQEEALRLHEEQMKTQHELRLKAETSRCRRKYLTGILRQLIVTLNDHRPRGEAAVVDAVTRLQVACAHNEALESSSAAVPSSSSISTSLSPYHTALHTVVTLLGTSIFLHYPPIHPLIVITSYYLVIF